MIRHLKEIVEKIKSKPVRTLVVACGEDPYTIKAVARSVKENITKVTLVGNKDKINNICAKYDIEPSLFEIMHEPRCSMAVERVVRLARNGECDFLMKGLIDTASYLHAILDRDKGLLLPGNLLSYVTLVEFPLYAKLLIVSDAAVIPSPTLPEKIAMTNYCIDIAHKLGIECPKVAIITSIEKVNPEMEDTLHAAAISKMADRGQIKGALIDGPLALDVAVSEECCKIKGVKSEVAGDADILIFPNIETGNVFFKTSTSLAKCNIAAVVTGTKVPCILTSRADTDDSKFYSICLGALLTENTSEMNCS